MAFKYFNVKNGLSTGNITLNAANSTVSSGNLIVSGDTDLGSISNVTITGGSSGQVLSTDGAGNLSFISTSVLQSPAPMPYVIDESTALVIPLYYQGLFSVPITVNGSLEIDGILVEV